MLQEYIGASTRLHETAYKSIEHEIGSVEFLWSRRGEAPPAIFFKALQDSITELKSLTGVAALGKTQLERVERVDTQIGAFRAFRSHLADIRQRVDSEVDPDYVVHYQGDILKLRGRAADAGVQFGEKELTELTVSLIENTKKYIQREGDTAGSEVYLYRFQSARDLVVSAGLPEAVSAYDSVIQAMARVRYEETKKNLVVDMGNMADLHPLDLSAWISRFQSLEGYGKQAGLDYREEINQLTGEAMNGIERYVQGKIAQDSSRYTLEDLKYYLDSADREAASSGYRLAARFDEIRFLVEEAQTKLSLPHNDGNAAVYNGYKSSPFDELSMPRPSLDADDMNSLPTYRATDPFTTRFEHKGKSIVVEVDAYSQLHVIRFPDMEAAQLPTKLTLFSDGRSAERVFEAAKEALVLEGSLAAAYEAAMKVVQSIDGESAGASIDNNYDDWGDFDDWGDDY
jgi:hypothetical protein